MKSGNRKASNYKRRYNTSLDRTRLKRRRKRKIGRWVLLILLLSVGVFYGYREIHSVSENIILVERILVKGNRTVGSNSIIKASGLKEGMDMSRIKPEVVAKKLLDTFPYLKRVRVRKEVTGIVSISVRERKPGAIVADGGVYCLIDDEGTVIEQRVSPSDHPDLRILDGEIKVALFIVKYVKMLYPLLYEELVSVSVSNPGSSVLLLNDGTKFLLDADQIEKGLENAYLVSSIRRCQGQTGGYIDARHERLVYCGGI